jgi:hypothetical protein
MSFILNFLDTYKNKTILDEDENKLSLILNKGATIKQLSDFEKKYNIELPEDFKNLLLYSNGLNLFGVEIRALDEIEYIDDAGILIFHNWGNGDFDCLALNSKYETGSILFMNHSPDVLMTVSPSLQSWLESVMQEIEKFGVLFHPSDYNCREENGLYAKLKSELLY